MKFSFNFFHDILRLRQSEIFAITLTAKGNVRIYTAPHIPV